MSQHDAASRPALPWTRKALVAALLMVCPVAGLTAWELSARIRGRLDAHIDLALRHYRLLMIGLPGPERPEYLRLLRDRYGIENRVVAYCTVRPGELEYVKGYNAVSARAANRKFGRDVFAEAGAEAETIWKARNSPR